jgi:hypothetical protein
MTNLIKADMVATIDRLAKSIAEAIFTCGNEFESPTTRLQFMSGEWPDHERPQGGLSKEALEHVIYNALDELLPKGIKC